MVADLENLELSPRSISILYIVMDILIEATDYFMVVDLENLELSPRSISKCYVQVSD